MHLKQESWGVKAMLMIGVHFNITSIIILLIRMKFT